MLSPAPSCDISYSRTKEGRKKMGDSRLSMFASRVLLTGILTAACLSCDDGVAAPIAGDISRPVKDAGLTVRDAGLTADRTQGAPGTDGGGSDDGTGDGVQGSTDARTGTELGTDAGTGADAAKESGTDTVCACAAGTVETGTPAPCGNCGTQTPTRTCLSTCQWDVWVPGTCTGEGCTPGDTKSSGCGDCEINRCNQSCEWECDLAPGNCAYGDLKNCTCWDGSTGEKQCYPNCTWSCCRYSNGTCCQNPP